MKWPVLLATACAVSVLSCAVFAVSTVPRPSLQLTTAPALSAVTPLEAEATKYLGSGRFQAPVELKFQARDPAGAPLRHAHYHLRIRTPAPTPWFTTDFPIVEGTTLLDLEGEAPTGAFAVAQQFPIRGTYSVQVDVLPGDGNRWEPISETLKLTIPENPLKIRYFPVVLAVLLAIGLTGGLIIGDRGAAPAGTLAPRRVRLLLSSVAVAAIAVLFWFNVSAELAEAHMDMAMGEGTSPAGGGGLIRSQGLELALTGDEQAVVGQLAAFRASLRDGRTQEPVRDVVFDVRATQQENHWVAFAHRGVPDQKGMVAWQEQFFDGAPHVLTVTVSPRDNGPRSFEPFEVTKVIPVEAVAPSLAVRLVGLVTFTGVVALGTAVGVWLRRCRSPAA